MTDLASQRKLDRASPQLPVDWYFDPQVYALEQKALFQRGPGYIGHELLVPAVGDYHVLERLDNARALVRNAAGVSLLSKPYRKSDLAQKIREVLGSV